MEAIPAKPLLCSYKCIYTAAFANLVVLAKLVSVDQADWQNTHRVDTAIMAKFLFVMRHSSPFLLPTS